MQLSGLDLNLLPLLHAVLEEASVAKAARRVGLSASAASHALSRLREQLDDPILVRAGRRLVPTPRGRALLPHVQRIVADLDALYRRPGAIDPATLKRSFQLIAADDVRTVVLGPLDAWLRGAAPGVDVFALQFGPGVLDRLRDGEADVAVAVFDEPPDDFEKRPLYEDTLVSVARARHPAASVRHDAASFAALPHALVAPLGRPRGLVDDLLAKRGVSRRIHRTVPTFLDAVGLVAESDLVVTLPSRLVDAVQARFGLVRLDVALPMPTFRISALWHRRVDADAEHAWFRAAIGAAVGTSRAGG